MYNYHFGDYCNFKLLFHLSIFTFGRGALVQENMTSQSVLRSPGQNGLVQGLTTKIVKKVRKKNTVRGWEQWHSEIRI